MIRTTALVAAGTAPASAGSCIASDASATPSGNSGHGVRSFFLRVVAIVCHMARPLRIEFPGALYHVMARGDGRSGIFKDDEDRELFLSTLGKVCSRFDWQIWAYCLMGNHYHLLIETARASLARGMRELNGQYTQAFNRRHRRVGHLLQGRYKALLVEKDSYLLELSRYVVLNPVRAGMVASAGDWFWSNYGTMMGKAPRPTWLAVKETLALFHAEAGPGKRAYSRFVAEGISAPDPLCAV
ncbi:MAG: transposase, partial [Burkholderiales bacterium]